MRTSRLPVRRNVQSLVGFATVTGALPWVTMWLAGIAAVTCPAFTNVVVRAAPFQRTWEVPTKLLPFTVSVKAAPPAGVLVGASDVSAGTGFAGALMVNVKAVGGPPAGRRIHHRHRRAPLR